MNRLLFEKTGNSVWISHLDLMRVFQRAFRRAGLQLKHSQGFNPRAIVSIALPLSVGMESCCELLDFELEGEGAPLQTLPQLLNDKLPSGIRVLACYEAARKIKDLTLLSAAVTLHYDAGVPEQAAKTLQALFERESLVLLKHSRKGEVETDIRPLLKSLAIRVTGERTVELDALVCAQNPSLNPQLLVSAIERYEPQLRPDHSVCRRLEIFDENGQIFR